jgi:TetR/AcrR family transcriptional regulator, lmrAB and yxaGH operons repressor
MAELSPRQRLIDTTSRLLESQGYHATGLNQIVAESEAPKGSLYHYFPEGKEALAAQAITERGRQLVEGTARLLAMYRDPAESLRQFVLFMAKNVSNKDFCGGNPITLAALESSAQADHLQLLSGATSQVYAQLVEVFENHLLAAGIDPSKGRSLAVLVVASIEGGMILARTQRSAVPLEQIAEEVFGLIKQL